MYYCARSGHPRLDLSGFVSNSRSKSVLESEPPPEPLQTPCGTWVPGTVRRLEPFLRGVSVLCLHRFCVVTSCFPTSVAGRVFQSWFVSCPATCLPVLLP